MTTTKVPTEHVVLEHPDGRAHVTIDHQAGAMRHYCTDGPPEGEVVAHRIGQEIAVKIPRSLLEPGGPPPTRTSAGPAQVASRAYLDGWDGIDWGTKAGGGGLPS